MATFEVVVRTGGFTAAARQLGISKQTVSDHVAKLEEALGIRLLERTTRKVRPTEAGEQCYVHCAEIVKRAEMTAKEMQENMTEPSGILRIASTSTFGELYLVNVVSEFLNTWPRVEVDLVFADRLVHPIEEGFDVAFWPKRPGDTSCVARRVGPAYTYFVAHKRYLARHPPPASPENLQDTRVIDWTPRGSPRSPKTSVLRVSSASAALTAVMHGVGIARLPSVLIAPEVQAQNLVVLFEGEPASATEIHAVYPSGRFLPPKVRRFIDLVCERIEPMKPFTQKSRPKKTKKTPRR